MWRGIDFALKLKEPGVVAAIYVGCANELTSSRSDTAIE